jgi:hypothetical protein
VSTEKKSPASIDVAWEERNSTQVGSLQSVTGQCGGGAGCPRRSRVRERLLVVAENAIRPGHAANRYSWTRPKTASLRRNYAGFASSIGVGEPIASGASCPRARCRRFSGVRGFQTNAIWRVGAGDKAAGGFAACTTGVVHAAIRATMPSPGRRAMRGRGWQRDRHRDPGCRVRVGTPHDAV